MNGPFLHLVSALTLTSLTTLLLGILVYFTKRNSRVGRIFLLYSLSISWWSFFQIWHMTARNEATAMLWARVMEPGALCSDMLAGVLTSCSFMTSKFLS